MLRFLESMQFVLFVFFTAAYAYQIVYLIIGWVGKGKGGNENAKLHRYAAVVAGAQRVGGHRQPDTYAEGAGLPVRAARYLRHCGQLHGQHCGNRAERRRLCL